MMEQALHHCKEQEDTNGRMDGAQVQSQLPFDAFDGRCTGMGIRIHRGLSTVPVQRLIPGNVFDDRCIRHEAGASRGEREGVQYS